MLEQAEAPVAEADALAGDGVEVPAGEAGLAAALALGELAGVLRAGAAGRRLHVRPHVAPVAGPADAAVGGGAALGAAALVQEGIPAHAGVDEHGARRFTVRLITNRWLGVLMGFISNVLGAVTWERKLFWLPRVPR